jgi:hypothetical protein
MVASLERANASFQMAKALFDLGCWKAKFLCELRKLLFKPNDRPASIIDRFAARAALQHLTESLQGMGIHLKIEID